MRKIRENVVIPGGWMHPEKIGEVEIEIRAESYRELLAKVSRVRLANGLSSQRTEHDVSERIASLFPRWDKGPKGVDTRPHSDALIDRVNAWIHRAAEIPVGEEHEDSDDEAARKIAICEACPHRVKWRTQCGPCNEEVERRIFIALGGRRLRGDIGGCRLHGFDIEAASRLGANTTRNEKAPSKCWIPKS